MKEQEKKMNTVDAEEKDLKEADQQQETKETKPGFVKKIIGGVKKGCKVAAPVAKKTLNVVAKIGGIGAAAYVAYKGVTSNRRHSDYTLMDLDMNPTLDTLPVEPIEPISEEQVDISEPVSE